MSDLPKVTIKQEKFARQYVGPCEGNASAAYRAVYAAENMSDEAVWVASSRLVSHAKVSLWIDHLKAEYSKKEAITVEEISTTLRRAVEGAAAAGQWSAVSQATLGLAKLGGLLVEKRQISVDDEGAHLDAVSALAEVPRRKRSDDEETVVPLAKTG